MFTRRSQDDSSDQDGADDGSVEGPALSRRGFLGISGAAGAAALTEGRIGSVTSGLLAGDEQTEVAVVGAGLAGLTAARTLHDAGADVLVLASAPPSGGRLVAGDGVQAAATATVPAGHQAVLALADGVGIPTAPAPPVGEHVTLMGGERHQGAAGALSGDPEVDREVGVALRTLNLMAAEVDPATPWAASNAAVRDRASLGSWFDDNVGSRAGRGLCTLLARSTWAAEPAEVSLLHALATIAGAGGVGPLVDAALAPGWRGPRLVRADESSVGHDAPRSCRTCRRGQRPFEAREPSEDARARVLLPGGASAITDRLAASLRGHVREATPVRSIIQDPGGVRVAGDDFTIRARHVVVALAPAALGGIAFEPTLPTPHEYVRRLGPGDAFSVECRYESLFAGAPARVAGTGPLTAAQLERSRFGTTVVAHACGASGRAWARRSEDERRRLTLRELADWFGPRASEPRSYHELDSFETLTVGAGWSVVAPPGSVTASQGLREPHGRVRWAGAERAAEWAGWLEGAVRSGHRAAREIVDGTPSAEAPSEAVMP